MSDPNHDETSSEEPKIIVDSDWKEQVAKEKEAASAKAESEPNSGKDASAEEKNDDKSVTSEQKTPAAGEAQKADQEAALQSPPPASFEVLISMLFTQAMATLGQIPDPASGEAKVNKPFAKHYIDTIDMLGEKTKGNLSDDESKMLSEALHALRMMYVNTKATS
ncbi:protein containing DUF1844 [Rhodopirellula maiorica SM1]|uniref:Protein containing DUF1844 n=1 Tax=Rhodopirellula maiorica SM1 TaxID=1265738 RepID=M5RI72_9BACT|nr:DUF1844 domain-containing protein [Rhodopirellula maiorica]EMI18995.1 protein containing DUF1844 [Rhodopirellula maiorica SM1]